MTITCPCGGSYGLHPAWENPPIIAYLHRVCQTCGREFTMADTNRVLGERWERERSKPIIELAARAK
jgi:hypothetical protein